MAIETFRSPNGEVNNWVGTEALLSNTLSCQLSKYEFILRPKLPKLTMSVERVNLTTQSNFPSLPSEIDHWYSTQNIKRPGIYF